MATEVLASRLAAAANVSLQRFADIIATLRAPDGCPWDRAQTHESLKPYFIEETYEYVEAVESGDDRQMREELGDVLLQIVLHAQIAAERRAFTLQDVVDTISEKMVRRHPHVFGDENPVDVDAVKRRWEEEKRKEGKSLLGGIPRALPALQRAAKVVKKVTHVGFDWPSVDGVVSKLREEVDELEAALRDADEDHALDEVGDVLFTAVCVAHKLQRSPEGALRRTLRKFEARFGHIEEALIERGSSLQEASLEGMEELWQEAKSREVPEGGRDEATTVEAGSNQDSD